MVDFPGGQIYRVNPSKIEETLNKDEEMIYKLGNTQFPKNASWIEENRDKAYHGQIYITDMRIIFEGERSSYGSDGWYYPEKMITINLEKIVQFKYSVVARGVFTKGKWKGDKLHYHAHPYGPELLIEKLNGKSDKFIIPKATPPIIEKLENIRKNIVDKMTSDAKDREVALDYDVAIQIWENLGEMKESTRVRKLKADLASPKTEIHGDYIDDRDTIIKDSVLNRSNVGGGSSKMQELKELTEMKKEGLIDDDEFKQMKKEILGK